MKTETKQWIFFLLTLGLSITFAVLTSMGITSLFGNGEPFDPREGFVGLIIWTGIFSVPTAYGVNAVFNLIGFFPDEDLTNKK